ncbi:hypothetical protein PC119_g22068 [Phytophthora cactorum]|uniref:Uncharacterized protein n=1 Tax=Phytophthora cactorum TaxID=29920 RepID=A0A8T1BFU8_9STRA|nr:hypothetical protein PC114_g22584 [Phytophthora cactorum]KAG2899233.1 hypothetical protein PC117_g22324 [Phytophthora cactorum]KAG2976853.1 hypothetical protein PC119_g22068 [Phytophthora cactorum]
MDHGGGDASMWPGMERISKLPAMTCARSMVIAMGVVPSATRRQEDTPI